MVDPELINSAFKLFLGRAPNDVNALNFATLPDLFMTLYGSKEFKATGFSRKDHGHWPVSQYFYSKKHRVVYCPIGKNACSFFKSAMVKIEQHPAQEILLESVHFLTDHINTGLQLSDYSRQNAHDILHDPANFKFAILRDPARRLLSAYIEKFVRNRLDASNLKFHTSALITAVQENAGEKGADFQKGISFQSFVDYILSQPPQTLDPHWRPQHLYLGASAWSNLYAFETLETAISKLEEISNIPLHMPAINHSGSGIGVAYENANLLLPAELDHLPMICEHSFITPKIRSQIQAYYAQDYELLQRCGQDNFRISGQ